MTINERIATLEKQTEESGKTIWRVFEAIYGNGKPGLLTEFQMLRKSVEEHHKEVVILREHSQKNWQWLITTGVAAAAVVVAFVK